MAGVYGIAAQGGEVRVRCLAILKTLRRQWCIENTYFLYSDITVPYFSDTLTDMVSHWIPVKWKKWEEKGKDRKHYAKEV